MADDPSQVNMPELPEVESARSLVEAHCVGAKVVKVEFNADGTFDEKIFAGTTAAEFRKALVGKTLSAARRLGKHMWWDLSGSGSPGRSSPLFHFGMTGAMSIKGKGAMKYKAFVVDVANWPPRFAKLVVTFSNGVALAYTDPRRFGRIRLVAGDVTRAPPISELGFDPLLDMPDQKQFAAHFAKRAAPIKSVLLDQKIAAGVGNWIADEVLYQAAIHPEQPARSLAPSQVSRMREAMSYVVTSACEAGADADKFPDSWLFHYRWGKVAGKVGGRAISFITVGGRTTAFVPGVQKKTSAMSTSAPATEGVGKRKRSTKVESEGVIVEDLTPKREAAKKARTTAKKSAPKRTVAKKPPTAAKKSASKRTVAKKAPTTAKKNPPRRKTAKKAPTTAKKR